MISRTVISLRVNVPVLSEQITVTAPSVSTLGNFRMRALRLTMRCKPSAKAMVTTAGSPLGNGGDCQANREQEDLQRIAAAKKLQNKDDDDYNEAGSDEDASQLG
ncbi:MAG: hypothetical protein KatS3mg105_3526 [Gemmatales bacterium]|nr:MAG: hypothetical protein KatS3mg105_3526 [Gemmatales bacterium]